MYLDNTKQNQENCNFFTLLISFYYNANIKIGQNFFFSHRNCSQKKFLILFFFFFNRISTSLIIFI
ncbi:uncharacterized protein ASCRUDRAFT_117307 [Ascoidea rubescens DSM 1968]|uniref:Transmembrane protein n=1 Tax=Ascoidea rubescens DSM 1968 TaxID=1344418 RepID=A0A1D2VAZ8_9ASCO|nr:hypothetical protein ASCRUDRAFT_117307 [Ascoidea rubescens DSM 1968]ODV58874.1 hypothetical protein ASCRUDRAFT_117307 [Ascoidea rubescens DSM 1968]